MAAWHYEGEYAVYDPGPSAAVSTLHPENRYYAVRDERGDLVGYCCFGSEARLSGGVYDEAALDVGLGLRPDLTGRGLGAAFVTSVLAFARDRFRPKTFRLTVWEWNVRAVRVYARLGFRATARFRGRGTEDGKQFILMVKEA